jgi:hypothetical protein
MPRGVNTKPDHLKAGETVREGAKAGDDLSTVDRGLDFVKTGEDAQRGNHN